MSQPDHVLIARRLLRWFDRHGRRHLPWQRRRTPYRVWVSEVMLQQTQVDTAAPYYQRFMRRFPTAAALAAAPLDEVLHHWSGLGYYARARNLHRAAQVIVGQHRGRFPKELDKVLALPGVGRSTAGAILALSRGERHPILDGNVKRVLSRVFAIATPVNDRATENELWLIAARCLPRRRIADYTQAIMDLGATLCARTRPRCAECPLSGQCLALKRGLTERVPAPRRRAGQRRRRETHMLLVVNDSSEVLLQRRPGHGIWGGLWSPPEFADEAGLRKWSQRELHVRAGELRRLPALRHVFTHFDLDIHPSVAALAEPLRRMERTGYVWYNSRAPARLGLAAPVARLIRQAVAQDPDGRAG